MHYDPASDELSLLRSKEEADDYRYFPEPDLVPVEPDPAHLDELRAALTELPLARIARLGTPTSCPTRRPSRSRSTTG